MASTSDLQEQALTFYKNKSNTLTPSQNTLSLITHDSSNFPSWLIAGILQQSVSTNNECFLSPNFPSINKESSPSYVYSFTNTIQTYNKYFLKYNIKNNENLHFTSFINSDAPTLASWYTSIISEIKSNRNPVVIIENPELVLLLDPTVTINKLLSQIQEIQKHCALYIVSTTSTSSSFTSTYLPSILHRSSLIISLTALTTGRADDISGTLTISTGPIPNENQIESRQYSYLISNSAVKLYFK